MIKLKKERVIYSVQYTYDDYLEGVDDTLKKESEATTKAIVEALKKFKYASSVDSIVIKRINDEEEMSRVMEEGELV